MLPPKPTVAAHAALMVLRRHSGLLGRRLALDVGAGSVVALTYACAWQALTEASFSSPAVALAVSLALGLCGSGLYVLFRVVTRAGTILALFQRLREGDDSGIALLGANAFGDALASSYVVAALEAFGALLVMMTLQLAGIVAHTVLGAAVAALVSAATITFVAWVSLVAGFAYVLSVIDGATLAASWSRFMLLISAPGASARFFGTALWLFPLSFAVAIVDFVSTAVSSAMPDNSLPASFVCVPLVLAAYAVLIDTVAVIFVAAVTDRLPLGFAARISLTVGPA